MEKYNKIFKKLRKGVTGFRCALTLTSGRVLLQSHCERSSLGKLSNVNPHVILEDSKVLESHFRVIGPVTDYRVKIDNYSMGEILSMNSRLLELPLRVRYLLNHFYDSFQATCLKPERVSPAGLLLAQAAELTTSVSNLVCLGWGSMMCFLNKFPV